MSTGQADADAVTAALPHVAETLAEAGESDAIPDAIAGDELFDLVSSTRRRETILLLADNQQGVDQPRMHIGDMASYVAGVMSDTPDDISDSEYRSSLALLYQHHLPRLERDGLVTIERPESHTESWVIEPTVDLTPIADAIRSVETVCARFERTATDV